MEVSNILGRIFCTGPSALEVLHFQTFLSCSFSVARISQYRLRLIENIIYQSSPLIHFVIPSEPIIVILHLVLVALNPAFTHSGFEKILNKDNKLMDSADFHHQLHHKYFDCNYGNVDVPLDVWFGTDHDGSDQATEKLRVKRKKNFL